MKSAQFALLPMTQLPAVTFDGGVWHCEGRLVTPVTAKTAYDEAKFWLAIAYAEQDRNEKKQAANTGHPDDDRPL